MATDDASTCRLLGGAFANGLQLVLAVIAFSTLLLKRARERPPLELRIWVLNVGKQVVSLTVAHAFAVVASIFVSTTLQAASECAWYAVIFSVDTVVGTALALILHKCALQAAQLYVHKQSSLSSRARSVCEMVVNCGSYGSPPSLVAWAWQALEWTLCVLLARFLCATVVAFLGPTLLAAIAEGIDQRFGGHQGLQLVSVMILWPLLVNIAQVLLQDAVLRAKRLHGGNGVTIVETTK